MQKNSQEKGGSFRKGEIVELFLSRCRSDQEIGPLAEKPVGGKEIQQGKHNRKTIKAGDGGPPHPPAPDTQKTPPPPPHPPPSKPSKKGHGNKDSWKLSKCGGIIEIQTPVSTNIKGGFLRCTTQEESGKGKKTKRSRTSFGGS